MTNAPIVTFRSSKVPYAVISALSYVQSTLGGNNLPVVGGENSNLVYFRVYNNFDGVLNIAAMENIFVTVFDGADPASHTATKSPVAQSWVRIYESGFGQSTGAPGQYTQFMGIDTAIGRSGVDGYKPEIASSGKISSEIYAGPSNDGVGFIEFATYVEAPDGAGFADYSFALAIEYDWTT